MWTPEQAEALVALWKKYLPTFERLARRIAEDFELWEQEMAE